MKIPQSLTGLTIAGFYGAIVALSVYESQPCNGHNGCFDGPMILGGPVLMVFRQLVALVWPQDTLTLVHFDAPSVAAYVLAYSINVALIYTFCAMIFHKRA